MHENPTGEIHMCLRKGFSDGGQTEDIVVQPQHVIHGCSDVQESADVFILHGSLASRRDRGRTSQSPVLPLGPTYTRILARTGTKRPPNGCFRLS